MFEERKTFIITYSKSMRWIVEEFTNFPESSIPSGQLPGGNDVVVGASTVVDASVVSGLDSIVGASEL